MDFSVRFPEEATKGLWNGIPGKVSIWSVFLVSIFFAALLWVLGAQQICDPARWILRREV
jgi:hypothetical protein